MAANNPLKMVSPITKSLLDEDYKALVKAGWVNPYDLRLTPHGVERVLLRYLEKNKHTFAEAAREDIKEDEE